MDTEEQRIGILYQDENNDFHFFKSFTTNEDEEIVVNWTTYIHQAVYADNYNALEAVRSLASKNTNIRFGICTADIGQFIDEFEKSVEFLDDLAKL